MLHLGNTDTESERKETEIEVRDGEALEFYDAQFTNYQTAVAMAAVTQVLELSETSTVLDLGCGTGRISMPLLTQCESFIGIDYSMAFLQKFKSKVGRRKRFDLIRADLNHMPLRLHPAFDRIVSAEVLEHLPSQQLRRHFLTCCHDLLHPHGRLVLTTYNFSLTKRFKKLAKEGLHSAGIYYYCYDAIELKQEMADFFHVENLSGFQNVPLRIQKFLSDRFVEWLEHLFASVRLDRTLGYYLLVSGRPIEG
jgi:cyclopropane fatty-acyl-phospholipid synthase-like methyltransferase